jgi:small subunit ribosomal protein S16
VVARELTIKTRKMPVKIRLSRHGKKHNAYYHIVVADSRAPRDGKFIEVIGNYDPNTNPATIQIDNDKALSWLNKGAQPTDTCRAILSYKGILFRNHLQKGVAKGVLTQEVADEKINSWQETKNNKIAEKKNRLKSSSEKAAEERLSAEVVKRDAIAEAVRKKNTPPPVEAPVAEETSTPSDASEAPAENTEA